MNINSWKGAERNKERSTDDPRQDDMKTTNMKRYVIMHTTRGN